MDRLKDAVGCCGDSNTRPRRRLQCRRPTKKIASSRPLGEGQENSWGTKERSEESCLKAWVGMKKATGNMEASLPGLGG